MERVDLMRGDDTPATTAGTLHQSQPVPNIIEYIDIMQLAFREGRWSQRVEVKENAQIAQ